MRYESLSYADQKRTIVTDLNKFVNHCDQVYKHSVAKRMITARTLDKISIVKDRVIEVNTHLDLYTICLRIWGLKKALCEILPNPLNNSYGGSLVNLTEMVQFSKEYILTHNTEATKVKQLTVNELIQKLQTA